VYRRVNALMDGEYLNGGGDVWDDGGGDIDQYTKRSLKTPERITRPQKQFLPFFQSSLAEAGQMRKPAISETPIMQKIHILVEGLNAGKNPLIQLATNASFPTSNNALDTASLRRLWNIDTSFLFDDSQPVYRILFSLSKFFSNFAGNGWAGDRRNPGVVHQGDSQ